MDKHCVGKVLNLFISKEDRTNRLIKKTIYLDQKGIIEDKFYDKSIKRSVLIASTNSYSLIRKNKIDIEFGELDENLLIDYNPYNLQIGTKLQIGNAILEVSQNCTICSHLSRIDKKLPKLLKNDRGIFAKVIQEGVIKVDNKIYLL